MAEKILGNIVQKINHFSGNDEKMQTLRKTFKTLSCQAADVKEAAEAEEFRTGKKRKRVVDNWLGEVEMMKNEVQKLEENQESQISSLLLGNRIDKLIKDIEELREEGRFLEGHLLHTCKTKAEPLLAPELTIQTSKQNLEKIFKYLMDDEVWCIGIHGIGGVGKTTLALHIYNRLVQDVGTFGYRPYWITVSQENTISKLQNDIAKNLGLDFSNEDDKKKTAANLSRALTRENCVLILDDVWEKIALDKVGIPEEVNGHKTCKLILTTRSLDVCRRIGCQAKFRVQPLNEEEAWKLFEENMGQQTKLSPEVRDIAMHVAAKCAGLPLAIITMAGSMREVNDIQEWRNVLKTLELTMEQEDMENEVYPILEFSYNHLKDMKLKLCFLYCALYPEDEKIYRDELIRSFISEGLIDEGKPWQAKFDEGHSMLNTLERSSLLESCEDDDGRRCVKMHDLMRDMALKITKAGHPQFMVKAGVGLRDIPAEWEWTEYLGKVSLMANWIRKIPRGHSPRCPSLSTLLLNNNCLTKIADSFFEHMHALHVLDLSMNENLAKLPNSISDLKNLTALKLQGCTRLTYVPPLGKLRALQELDLRFTRIKEVPEGLDRLHALHILDLSKNRDLEKLPNSISDLENLTALKLQGCTRLTYVPPLGKLRALQELDLRFTRIKEVPEGVDRLHALHILDLSENRDLAKLPNSISDLENLTALKLQGCKHLTYVPPLGKLRALQELDLSCTRIKEVPEGMDGLVNLKNLNMDQTLELERLPSGILGKLSHLQRLKVYTLGPVEVQAKELEGLRELTEITVWLSDIDGFKQFVKYLQQAQFGGQLDKYFVAVCDEEYNYMTYNDDFHFKKVLILKGPCNVDGGGGGEVIFLPYDLQRLIIATCSFAGNACLYDYFGPSLCGNATALKECELSNCEGIESIISSSTSSYSSTSFQSLEKLYLDGLPDFVSLNRFAVIPPSCGTFSNLKDLSVRVCHKIKSLFTSISPLLLPNLEVISVWHCYQIKEIIETVHEVGSEKITLPKLKKISLEYVPELKGIFEGRMVCESIEEITLCGCPNLRRLPFFLPSVDGRLAAPTSLKKIAASESWWESLGWDDPNAKDALRPYLVEYY